jgi:outer membrane protein OmpA-like peptidoglycan-associated protein
MPTDGQLRTLAMPASPAWKRSLQFISAKLFMNAIVLALALHASGSVAADLVLPISVVAQHYQLKDPADLTDDEFNDLLSKSAAGRPGRPVIPWDFRPSGTTNFYEDSTGLSAAAREKLAASMNSFEKLDYPYSSLYCYRELVIQGSKRSDEKTQALVLARVASVARWFIEHGYDSTLIQTYADGAGAADKVDWEIVGGISTLRQCEQLRNAVRRK